MSDCYSHVDVFAESTAVSTAMYSSHFMSGCPQTKCRGYENNDSRLMTR